MFTNYATSPWAESKLSEAIGLHDNPFRLSFIEYSEPVGKQFDIAPDLSFTTKHLPRPAEGTALAPEAMCLQDYAKKVVTLPPSFMPTAGTFESHRHSEPVYHKHVAGLSATNEYLEFRKEPGICRGDTDYKEAGDVPAIHPNPIRQFATHDELIDLIRSLDPALADVGFFVSDSSSSFIHYKDGRQVTGRKGIHFEFSVDDASRIPEVLELLHKRLWLAGHGWSFVSNGATILHRSPVDLALGRPHQPFFTTCSFKDGCGESRAKSSFYTGGMLKVDALAELTLDEEKKYANLIAEAKAVLEPARQKQLDDRVAAKAAELKKAGIPAQQAVAAAKSLFNGVLLAHASVTFLRHGDVTVEQLLLNGEQYDGKQCLDPTEPDYPASVWFFWNQGINPMTFGYTHGESIHRLRFDEDLLKRIILSSNQTAIDDDLIVRAFANADIPKVARTRLLRIAASKMGIASSTKALTEMIADVQPCPPPGKTKASAAKGAPGVDVFDQTAEIFLRETFQGGETLIQSEDRSFWRYTRTHWERLQDNVLGGILHDFLKEHWNHLPVGKSKATTLLEAVGHIAVLVGHRVVEPGDPLRFRLSRLPVINCTNGELWLLPAGPELRHHDPKSFLVTPPQVAWTPTAQAPTFNVMLKGMMSHPGGTPLRDQKEMVRHIKEILGYAIQPSRSLKHFVLWKGQGDNGKTLLMELARDLIGMKGCLWTALGELTNRFATADLATATMFVDDDYKKGTVIPDDLVKKTAEQKQMTGEFKNKDKFSFICQVILVILANHWPPSRDLSHGMDTRALVIDFPRTFHKTTRVGPNHPDIQRPELKQTIYERELPGVLRELVDGYYRVVKRGNFNEPPSALRARSEWLLQSNSTGQFIDDRLVLTPKSNQWKLTAGPLFDLYTEYCMENRIHGRFVQTKNRFKTNLEDLGIHTIRAHQGSRWYIRARLRRPSFDDAVGTLGGFPVCQGPILTACEPVLAANLVASATGESMSAFPRTVASIGGAKSHAA